MSSEHLLLSALLALLLGAHARHPQSQLPGQSPEPPCAAAAAYATEPCEVKEVVDGDTIHVTLDGKLEKLRLLSVDCEEKIAPGLQSSASKPQTVFGTETALWAKGFFATLAAEDGRARVRLAFPGGRRERDVYGRLLCHVLLHDGSNFNLLLVRGGWSPYFDKYGRDLLCHEDFAAAQQSARERQVGIWNPSTNEPPEAGAPSAKRPYERLLPWWNERALAVEDFRRLAGRSPEHYLSAEDLDALERAVVAGAFPVEIFGEPARFFDEEDGSRTVLFRSSDRSRALRVRILAEHLEAHRALELDTLLLEYQQNYVWVSGTLTRGARGYELVSKAPDQWRRAGAER